MTSFTSGKATFEIPNPGSAAALNFLKSALTLFEQWTEGNPNENLKKSEAMRKQTRVENVSWGL